MCTARKTRMPNFGYLCHPLIRFEPMKHFRHCRLLGLPALCALLAFAMPSYRAAAQGFEGDWHGTANLPGGALSFVFHITPIGATWQGTFDCPNQNAYGLSITAIQIPTQDSIHIQLPSINAKFKGKLRNDKIAGTFSQGEQTAQLLLTKKTVGPAKSE